MTKGNGVFNSKKIRIEFDVETIQPRMCRLNKRPSTIHNDEMFADEKQSISLILRVFGYDVKPEDKLTIKLISAE